ncbi:hypothetical protein SASPL_115377 [Salvia splendens]|uniref:Type 2A phosphatase activator TIP41 n=1 Tax=Salvia splendens TaxID=180675 RepID=A0A8X8Y510_SALSN|nr:hypothetical protein SASPL_115377 [Salvia splendens]
MEWESDERELKAAGAVPLGGGRVGFLIGGWEIETAKRSILNSSLVQQWEEKLQTTHLPEMVFGESCLILKHINSGITLHFNAYDALCGWKLEALPPVEVPAAALWKFRCWLENDCRFKLRYNSENLVSVVSSSGLLKFDELGGKVDYQPNDQVILDYDYTFTTPYSGSAGVEKGPESGRGSPGESICSPHWEDCEEQIDMVALSAKESILFYDEVVLYEDELADNGISLLTVKVRVMPSGWFLLLRFWLRVDGVLMRLRDTRMHCSFKESTEPVILREICWREATFKALSSKGYPTDSSAYSDPGTISERLPVAMRKTQKLIVK